MNVVNDKPQQLACLLSQIRQKMEILPESFTGHVIKQLDEGMLCKFLFDVIICG